MKKLPCLPTKKQLRAYFLCEVMGEPQNVAAELMGISRTAVTNLLTRFYDKDRPLHKGKATHTISLPENYEDHIKNVF